MVRPGFEIFHGTNDEEVPLEHFFQMIITIEDGKGRSGIFLKSFLVLMTKKCRWNSFSNDHCY